MVSGYVFWFILSKLTTSSTIGSASTLVSLATIFSVIATIGVPTGVQRFLGKLFAEQKIQDANVFIKSSLVLVTIGLFACLILIIITKDFFHNIFNYDHSLMLVFFVLIISLSMYNLFRSIIISSLKTRMLPIITLVSTSLKIVLGIILVLTGMGVLGMTMALYYSLFLHQFFSLLH